MGKRKLIFDNDTIKKPKIILSQNTKDVVVLYYCYLHDDDKDICQIYDCNGKNRKKQTDIKEYTN